jgi:protein phosphatase 1 regulatory subunit 7
MPAWTARPLQEIQGLDNLAALEELWLGKNKIRTLEVRRTTASLVSLPSLNFSTCCRSQNLSSLKKLKILSIQSNRITVLAGLEELESLEELYISHNGIAKIEGLAQNKRLRVLDVGNNRIEKIEGLEGLDELEEFWVRRSFTLLGRCLGSC